MGHSLCKLEEQNLDSHHLQMLGGCGSLIIRTLKEATQHKPLTSHTHTCALTPCKHAYTIHTRSHTHTETHTTFAYTLHAHRYTHTTPYTHIHTHTPGHAQNSEKKSVQLCFNICQKFRMIRPLDTHSFCEMMAYTQQASH